VRWGRFVARGAAEFAAIGEAEAADRLAAGRAVLASMGLVTDGFTPPGWLASPGSLRRAGQRGVSLRSRRIVGCARCRMAGCSGFRPVRTAPPVVSVNASAPP
jgi:hypothetical protein